MYYLNEISYPCIAQQRLETIMALRYSSVFRVQVRLHYLPIQIANLSVMMNMDGHQMAFSILKVAATQNALTFQRKKNHKYMVQFNTFQYSKMSFLTI